MIDVEIRLKIADGAIPLEYKILSIDQIRLKFRNIIDIIGRVEANFSNSLNEWQIIS
jgi:hypothetical protein